MFGLIKLSCTILGNKEIDLLTVVGVSKDCLEIRTPAFYQHPNSKKKKKKQDATPNLFLLCPLSPVRHCTCSHYVHLPRPSVTILLYLLSSSFVERP